MPTLAEMQRALISANQKRIADLRQQLRPLEDGSMHTGERHYPGPWVDTTQRDIARIKDGIAQFENTIAYLKRELGDA